MLASASGHANVSRVGRRATAPSSTLPALPEDHELRESSLLRVVETDTASPTATSIRSSRVMPKFTFTSDALPIDVPHHLIPSAVTDKNFELKEDFKSDAFGNGHLPLASNFLSSSAVCGLVPYLERSCVGGRER